MTTTELYKPFATVTVRGNIKLKQRRDIHTTTPKVLVTEVTVTGADVELDLTEVRNHFWVHLPKKLHNSLDHNKDNQEVEMRVKAYYYKSPDGEIKLGFKHPKKI